MISCKEATRLASLQLERKLSFWERIQFRFHLAYCTSCRLTEKQFQFLRKATGAWINHQD